METVASKTVGTSFAGDVVESYKEQRRLPAISFGENFDDLTPEDQKKKIDASREQVFSEIPHVGGDLKQKLDPNDEIFKKIAIIEAKITGKHEYLKGRKAIKDKDGKVTVPEIPGAYKCDAQAACETINRIKELQLSRKYYLGEVRIKLAEKRLELANDNFRIVRAKAGRTIEATEFPDVAKAGLNKIGARLNLMKEKFSSRVNVINADTENKIDIAKDFLIKLNPLRHVSVGDTLEQVGTTTIEAYGILKRAKETKGKSFVKELMESPAVIELKRKHEGVKAAKRVESLRIKKERKDAQYENWINFKDGIRRKAFEIKLALHKVEVVGNYVKIVREKGFPKIDDHLHNLEPYNDSKAALGNFIEGRARSINREKTSLQLDVGQGLADVADRLATESQLYVDEFKGVGNFASAVVKDYLPKNFTDEEQQLLWQPGLSKIEVAKNYMQIIAKKGLPNIDKHLKYVVDPYVRNMDDRERLKRIRDSRNSTPLSERITESVSMGNESLKEEAGLFIDEIQGAVKLGQELIGEYLPKNFSDEEKLALLLPIARINRMKGLLKKLGEGEENIKQKKILLDKKMAFNPWYKKVERHLHTELFGNEETKTGDSSKDKTKEKKTDTDSTSVKSPDAAASRSPEKPEDNKPLSKEDFEKQFPDKKGERLIVVTYKDDEGHQDFTNYYVWTDGKKMYLGKISNTGKRNDTYESATRDVKNISNLKGEFNDYINKTLEPFRKGWKENKFITADFGRRVDLSSGEFKIGKLPVAPEEKKPDKAPSAASVKKTAEKTAASKATAPEPETPLPTLEEARQLLALSYRSRDEITAKLANPSVVMAEGRGNLERQLKLVEESVQENTALFAKVSTPKDPSGTSSTPPKS